MAWIARARPNGRCHANGRHPVGRAHEVKGTVAVGIAVVQEDVEQTVRIAADQIGRPRLERDEPPAAADEGCVLSPPMACAPLEETLTRRTLPLERSRT